MELYVLKIYCLTLKVTLQYVTLSALYSFQRTSKKNPCPLIKRNRNDMFIDDLYSSLTVSEMNYAAPEYLLRKKVGKYADYYSIGLIAYEMIVGNVIIK